MKHVNKPASVLLRALMLILSATLLLSGIPLAVGATPAISTAQFTYQALTEQEHAAITAAYPANDMLDEPVEKTYVPYTADNAYRLVVEPIGHGVRYTDSLTVGAITYQVYGDRYAGDLLILESITEPEVRLVFFTEEALRKAEALAAGNIYDAYMVLYENDRHVRSYTHLDKDPVHSIIYLPHTDHPTMELTLNELRFASSQELVGYTHSSWVSARIGWIYSLEGNTYYLPADALPAEAYLADGTLDHTKKIELTLYQLPDYLEDDYEQAIRRLSYTVGGSFVSEESYTSTTSPSDAFAVVFILGLLPSLAPLIVGLCNYFSKKRKSKRRWLLLAAVGAMWFLCALFVSVAVALSIFL